MLRSIFGGAAPEASSALLVGHLLGHLTTPSDAAIRAERRQWLQDALDQMDGLYQDGADPLLVLQDLLDLGHFLTRLKLAPEAGVGDPEDVVHSGPANTIAPDGILALNSDCQERGQALSDAWNPNV